MIFNWIRGKKPPVQRPSARTISPLKIRKHNWLRILVLCLIGVLPLYYGIGALVLHDIDDSLDFIVQPTVSPQSESVEVAASLIEREINTHHWTANDPFFLPGAILDDMPSYQQGIIASISGFITALQSITAQDNSHIDPELEIASEMLTWPGTVWIFDPDISWWPIAAADKQYRKAAMALRQFNLSLLTSNSFSRRGQNLSFFMDWLINDLDVLSRASNEYLDEKLGSWVNFESDDIFYFAKGRLYADWMLMRALGKDYVEVLRHKGLEDSWQNLTDSMQRVAQMHPWIVYQDSADGFLPNHLINQVYLMQRIKEKAVAFRQSVRDSEQANQKNQSKESLVEAGQDFSPPEPLTNSIP